MWFDVTRRSFSIEQIVAALRQAESGTPEAELIRRLGISAHTFSRWKKLYGGRHGASYPASGGASPGVARPSTGIGEGGFGTLPFLSRSASSVRCLNTAERSLS